MAYAKEKGARLQSMGTAGPVLHFARLDWAAAAPPEPVAVVCMHLRGVDFERKEGMAIRFIDDVPSGYTHSVLALVPDANAPYADTEVHWILP